MFGVLLATAITALIPLLPSLTPANESRQPHHTEEPSMAATLLPATTGPYAVGNRRLFMSDPRPDPFTNTTPRKISVTAWYPTTGTGPAARYLSGTDSYDETMALELVNKLEGQNCSKSFWNGAISCGFFGNVSPSNTLFGNIRQRDTRAVKDAPIRTDLGPLPTAIFSPGFGMPGYMSAILAQDLASHGWLILTLSHTYESIATEWASGTIPQNGGYVSNQWAKCLNARVADLRYVLGQLPVLPNGIGTQADISKLALIGHSYGGTTAMETAHLEPQRVKAVAILDGPVGYPGTSNQAQNNGIPAPVLLLSGPVDPNDGYTTGAETVGWSTYAATIHGPLHRYQVAGAKHHAFTDFGALTVKPADNLGTITAARAMSLHPRWVRAFLATYVLGNTDPLLTLPATDWPEVTAVT